MMDVDDLRSDTRTKRVDGISLKTHCLSWPCLGYIPTSRSFSPKTKKTTQSGGRHVPGSLSAGGGTNSPIQLPMREQLQPVPGVNLQAI